MSYFTISAFPPPYLQALRSALRTVCATAALVLALALTASAQTNVFPASGSVGAGTSTPGAPLEVFSATGGYAAFVTGGGTSVTRFALRNETDQGQLEFDIAGGSNPYALIQAGKTANIGLQFSAASYAFLNGGVGIGTTALPTNGKLQVNGTIDAIAVNNAGAFRVYDGANFAGGVGSDAWAHNCVNTDFTVFTPNNLYLSAGSAKRVSILANGNVGIGTSTPTSKLTVEAFDTFDQFTVRNAAYYSGGWARGADMQFKKADGSYHRALAYGIYGSGDAPIGAYFSALQDNSSPWNPAQLFLSAAGNVGIGTSSPEQKLTVRDTNAPPYLSLISGDADWNGILFGKISNTVAGQILYNNSTNAMTFVTNTTKAMTIDSGGNAGIGTTSPGAKLEVKTPINDGGVGVQYTNWNNVVNVVIGASSVTGAGYFGVYDNNASRKVNIDAAGNSYFNGGRVGVATASPSTSFQVATDDIASGGITVGSGLSVDGGNLRLLSSTNHWNLDNNSGSLRFFTETGYGIGGTVRMTLSAAGDLGVTGNLTVNGVFSAANYTASNGTISGGSAGLTLNAGGNEQSITLQPSGYGGTVWAQNTNGQDSYPLKVRNGLLKANDNYLGLLLQSNDTVNPLTGALLLHGGAVGSRRLEIAAFDNGVGPANVVVPYGNLGVGTVTPQTKLDVVSSANAGELTALSLRQAISGNNFNDASTAVALEFRLPNNVDSYGSPAGKIVAGKDNANWTNGALRQGNLQFYTADGNTNNNVERMRIDHLGNVGIGTTNPGTYKLAVNGTVHAKEVVVDQIGWADYVFDENYRNAPLSEVEQHIKDHKHLPGVPSAGEVAEKGVSVGQMQAVLLQKIEELTLHQIAQEKRMSAQDERIAKLEAENAALRSSK